MKSWLGLKSYLVGKLIYTLQWIFVNTTRVLGNSSLWLDRLFNCWIIHSPMCHHENSCWQWWRVQWVFITCKLLKHTYNKFPRPDGYHLKTFSICCSLSFNNVPIMSERSLNGSSIQRLGCLLHIGLFLNPFVFIAVYVPRYFICYIGVMSCPRNKSCIILEI